MADALAPPPVWLVGSHIPMHDVRSLLSLPWNIQVVGAI